jgi:hypothetical protein
MKRLFGVALVTLAAGSLCTFAAGASAASAVSPWSAYEQEAVTAIGALPGQSAITATSALTAPITTSVTTASGSVISAVERSFVATDETGTVDVGLTLLGGEQVIVDVTSPSSSTALTVLSLAPGSSTVADSATAPVVAGTGAGSAADSASGSAAAVVSDASTNCYAVEYSPVVIGSDYGPLIQGLGGAACTQTTEVLGAIVSLSSNGTGVGSASGGSSSPNHVWSYLAPYDYAGCTVTSSASSFQTNVLYSIGGSVAGSGSSSASSLDCKP